MIIHQNRGCRTHHPADPRACVILMLLVKKMEFRKMMLHTNAMPFMLSFPHAVRLGKWERSYGTLLL